MSKVNGSFAARFSLFERNDRMLDLSDRASDRSMDGRMTNGQLAAEMERLSLNRAGGRSGQMAAVSSPVLVAADRAVVRSGSDVPQWIQRIYREYLAPAD